MQKRTKYLIGTLGGLAVAVGGGLGVYACSQRQQENYSPREEQTIYVTTQPPALAETAAATQPVSQPASQPTATSAQISQDDSLEDVLNALDRFSQIFGDREKVKGECAVQPIEYKTIEGTRLEVLVRNCIPPKTEIIPLDDKKYIAFVNSERLDDEASFFYIEVGDLSHAECGEAYSEFSLLKDGDAKIMSDLFKVPVKAKLKSGELVHTIISPDFTVQSRYDVCANERGLIALQEDAVQLKVPTANINGVLYGYVKMGETKDKLLQERLADDIYFFQITEKTTGKTTSPPRIRSPEGVYVLVDVSRADYERRPELKRQQDIKSKTLEQHNKAKQDLKKSVEATGVEGN